MSTTEETTKPETTKTKTPAKDKLKEVRSVFRVNPSELVIVSDTSHKLYDERQDYKRDAGKVAWSYENGAKGKTILAVREKKSGPLLVIDGRQTTLDVREANVQRVKAGLEPHLVDVSVITVESMDEAADLMDIHNSFRTDDSLMVLARKTLRRHTRLAAQTDGEGKPLFSEADILKSSMQVFRCSKDTIRNRLLAMTAIQEAQDACEAGSIGFGDLVEIAKTVKDAQPARLAEFLAKREGGDEDGEEEEEDSDGEAGEGDGEKKPRQRAKKGIGKSILKNIAENAPVGAAVQALCRLMLGEITKKAAFEEIPGLKGYLKPYKKTKDAPEGEELD